jgi:rsbT co-antagonist protein RsbR
MSSYPTIDALHAEIALLRQRVADLEASERALQNIVQTTFDQIEPVVYIRDPEGCFTLVNAAHARVLGRQRADILGKKDSDLFPREIWEGFRVNDRIVAETHQVIAQEEALPFEDGLHTFLSLKFPILDEAGALIATGGISTDITRQKRSDAALRESQSLLQAILDHSPIVIFAKDTEGRYILISSEGARRLGGIPRDILGKNDHELMPRSLADPIRADEMRVAETGITEEMETVILQDDGPHTYLTTKFPLRNAAGEIYAVCGVAQDITRIKLAEGERSRMREELIEAQEFAIRELSTPLIPIAEGVVAMPLLGTIDEARARQIVDTLLAGVAQQRASIVILDVTGVQHVDQRTIGAIVQVSKAVRLLGAEVVLTGIQPQMARTLVALDLKLECIITLSTLQSGIELALARRRPAGGPRQHPHH